MDRSAVAREPVRPVDPVDLILCSRGLVHSRTMEALIRAVAGCPARWWWTHDLPIPAAQEAATERALAAGARWLLYIEEDVVVPPDLMRRLDWRSLQPQCIDYKLDGNCRSVNRDPGGNVLFCGLGCFLVPADIMRAIPRPWFAVGHFTMLLTDRTRTGRLEPSQGDCGYGGQDIFFCWRLQEAGYRVRMVPSVECGHLRVCEYGRMGANSGCHRIEPR